MAKAHLINVARNSAWGRQLGLDSPSNGSLLDEALDVVAEYFWSCHRWFFRKAYTTMTVNAATEVMPQDVDIIEEMTYDDAGTPRYIRYRGADYIANRYDYVSDTDTVIYFWDEYGTNSDGNMVVRFKPTISSDKTVTVKYYKKFTVFDDIPSKFYPVLLIGLKAYMVTGNLVADPEFSNAVMLAKFNDKPHWIRKSAVEKDRVFDGGLK